MNAARRLPTQSTRAAFGTLVHAVLAAHRFPRRQAADRPARANNWPPSLSLKTPSQAAELAAEMIERFAASPRWPQIAAAKTVHRELEFLLAWPPGDTTGDGRYLQGFIDCLYQDASGGWHLVDYKTNDVAAADVPARSPNNTKCRCYVYALAVERVARPAAGRAGAPLPPPGRRAYIRLERRRPPPRHRTGERIDRHTGR